LSKSGTKQKNQILIKKENSYGKTKIYQFKVEDLSEAFDFSTLKEKSNDRKYSFKMWIDTTVQRSRSDL
jgi:hypothetical protein